MHLCDSMDIVPGCVASPGMPCVPGKPRGGPTQYGLFAAVTIHPGREVYVNIGTHAALLNMF